MSQRGQYPGYCLTNDYNEINMKAIQIKQLLNQVRLSVNANKQRQSRASSYLSTKLESNKTATPAKNDLIYNTIDNPSKPPNTFSKANRTSAITRLGPTVNSIISKQQNIQTKGMNGHLLFMRKQNNLNTFFNIRKNKLKEITKANKKIYRRLNTQKSFYSSTDLSKSYESTKEIKERLSQSKLSQRVNLSKNTSRKSLQLQVTRKERQKIIITTSNINNMDFNQVHKFRGLFMKDVKQVKGKIDKQNDQQAHLNLTKRDLPSKYPKNKVILKSVDPMKEFNEAGLLHRIVEDFGQNKINTDKKKSMIVQRNRRLFYL